MTSRRIDNNKLYKDLKETLDDDKMYWIRNDAKLRAVLTSKSYEEFRDIVAAAHLQPLTRQDKERKQGHWNRID